MSDIHIEEMIRRRPEAGSSRRSANVRTKQHSARGLADQPVGHPEVEIVGDESAMSFGRFASDEVTTPESSAAHLARHSASPSLSIKRLYSADAHPQDNVGYGRRHSSQNSPHALMGRRRRSVNASKRPLSRQADKNPKEKTHGADTFPRISADLANSLEESDHGHAPLQIRLSPVSDDSRRVKCSDPDSTRRHGRRTHMTRQSWAHGSTDESTEGDSTAVGLTESQGMFLQPETHPITEEQLIHEVRAIYAGLVMVEKGLIRIDKELSQTKSEIDRKQWEHVFGMHQTLLHEHHDFFLASQHPAASPAIRRLAEKYAMPARLWRYGIHSFLEPLRHRLPQSLDYMLQFIYYAYSMMTLLLESVPKFEVTWIECLGDLARYRMAVEEADMRDREVWAGVARYWYNKAADKSPNVGRIQHHLAVLARPDIVQQLFFYTKSLVTGNPFPSTRESILLLFSPLLDGSKSSYSPRYSAVTAFVGAHGRLFTEGPSDRFISWGSEFLSRLDDHMGRAGATFRLQGAYISSCNFAAIFEYGTADATLPAEFNNETGTQTSFRDAYLSAMKYWASSKHTSVDLEPSRSEVSDSSHLRTITCGSYLAFRTLSIVIDRIGDKNVFPTVHICLSFIWCLALNQKSMLHIEEVVPWMKTATFLNSMIHQETDTKKIESDAFPSAEAGATQQLPEDFMIRGQIWSRFYYPELFFNNAPTEDEGRLIETPSLNISRTHRCLWLGVRIATFNRWITYDSTSKRFSATSFAAALNEAGRKHDPFNQKANTEEIQSPAVDRDMQDV